MSGFVGEVYLTGAILIWFFTDDWPIESIILWPLEVVRRWWRHGKGKD